MGIDEPGHGDHAAPVDNKVKRSNRDLACRARVPNPFLLDDKSAVLDYLVLIVHRDENRMFN